MDILLLIKRECAKARARERESFYKLNIIH